MTANNVLYMASQYTTLKGSQQRIMNQNVICQNGLCDMVFAKSQPKHVHTKQKMNVSVCIAVVNATLIICLSSILLT